MPLYNRLKEYRAKIKVNQTEMGNLVGVSRQTISQIERGDYSPSVTSVSYTHLKIISDIHDVIEDIIDQNDIEKNQIKSIGFGIPGYIDRYGKANCVNLNWKKVDFIQKLKETFPGTDIFAENDATAVSYTHLQQ